MTIDINPTDLALVKTILQQHLKTPVTVYVFGSRATNKAKKYSDLDLVIDLSGKSVPSNVMTALAYDFEESTLPYKVDIVDWAEISNSFRQLIEHDRKIIWRA